MLHMGFCKVKQTLIFHNSVQMAAILSKLIRQEIWHGYNDYSGTLRATCPDFESHHSGEWEPYIPVIQSHLIGLYYIYFLYTVNTHLWCEYR